MALFSSIIISIFISTTSAWANHANVTPTTDLRPEGTTKLSSSILSLYANLSAFDPTHPDVAFFANSTEPAIDKLLVETPSEVEIADVLARFLGMLNVTQLRSLEIVVTKLLKEELTSEPPDKKYIALLKRLLRGKELRRGLDQAALVHEEKRYDEDLRAFDVEFRKAHKPVAEHNAAFQHYKAEAKKNANARAIFLHKYPHLLAFTDKERRTNLEKVKDDPNLTKGQAFANEVLLAISHETEGGERVLPLTLATGESANMALGTDPKRFHEKLEAGSQHVPFLWTNVSALPRPHPEAPELGKHETPAPEATDTPVEEPKTPATDPNALVSFEIQLKDVLERNCKSCHTNARSKAYKDLPFPKDGSWANFLRSRANKMSIYEAVINPDTRSMPPEDSKQLSPEDLTVLQNWMNVKD